MSLQNVDSLKALTNRIRKKKRMTTKEPDVVPNKKYKETVRKGRNATEQPEIDTIHVMSLILQEPDKKKKRRKSTKEPKPDKKRKNKKQKRKWH
jgi:hypothetical protein